MVPGTVCSRIALDGRRQQTALILRPPNPAVLAVRRSVRGDGEEQPHD